VQRAIKNRPYYYNSTKIPVDCQAFFEKLQKLLKNLSLGWRRNGRYLPYKVMIYPCNASYTVNGNKTVS
jgi:hypothetical protein